MVQPLHDDLDDVFIYVVEEGNFRIRCFYNTYRSQEVECEEKREEDRFVIGSSVTRTIINLVVGIQDVSFIYKVHY